MADLDNLKRKRDQLTAKIQKAEAQQRANAKKEDDRVKVLVGAAILDAHSKQPVPGLLDLMDRFLTRPAERLAVLGEDGQGSKAFKRLCHDKVSDSETQNDPKQGRIPGNS